MSAYSYTSFYASGRDISIPKGICICLISELLFSFVIVSGDKLLAIIIDGYSEAKSKAITGGK